MKQQILTLSLLLLLVLQTKSAYCQDDVTGDESTAIFVNDFDDAETLFSDEGELDDFTENSESKPETTADSDQPTDKDFVDLSEQTKPQSASGTRINEGSPLDGESITNFDKPKFIVRDDLPKNETIIVEPSDGIRVNQTTRTTYLVPYSQRRTPTGSVYGFSAGQPNPSNFEPNFVASSWDEVYGISGPVAIEFHGNIKKNYSTWSLGIEYGLGNYTVNSDPELIESSLSVTYIKVGSQIALDNIFANEPYIVPYISAGLYTIYYAEELNATSNNGNTEVSYYATGGLMFDIDWLDKNASDAAYFEGGIENTFLFLEASLFGISNHPKDPDFSGVNFNAGIKVEL